MKDTLPSHQTLAVQVNDENPAGKTPRHSFSRTLSLWFLLMALIPMLVVSAVSYYQARTSLTSSASSQLKEAALGKIAFVQNWFDYRFMELRSWAESRDNVEILTSLEDGLLKSGLRPDQYVKSPDWRRRVEAGAERLTSLASGFDHVYDLFLIDTNGAILFAVTRETDLGMNLMSGPLADTRFAQCFSTTLITKQPSFSDLERYSPSHDRIASFLATPILNESGVTVGVFAIQLKMDRVTEQVAMVHGDRRSMVHYLIGKDAKLRTAINGRNEEILTREIITEQYKHWSSEHSDNISHDTAEINRNESLQTYKGHNGQTVIGAHHDVRLPGVDWALISEIDQEEALASANLLKSITLTLVLLTALLAATLAFILARRITKPLEKLATASFAIAKGETDIQVDLGINNEFGRVADAFNYMTLLRQSNEEELQRSHEKAQKALADLAKQKFALDQHSHVSVTDLKGTITSCNNKFVALTGYERDELVGSNHRILKSGIQEESDYREMFQTISSGKVWNKEMCNRAKNGTLFWVDTTIVPFLGVDGKPTSYISISADITERKLAEEDLRKSTAKLEEQRIALQHAQKLEAVGTLAGGIAHDFNNLLGVILGYNELAQRVESNDETLGVHLSHIHTAGSRAKDLVKQILDFSRHTERALVPISIADVIEEVISSLQATKSFDIEFKRQVDSGVGCVMADHTEVHRIIMNLCTNAIQAMAKDGGLLSIDLDVIRVDKDFANEHLTLEGREYVRLSIRDTGCGISEENQKRIFEPFFTTKEVGKGTGLGLSTVHSSVKAMSGAVSVFSVKNEGTIFHVYLPQTTDSPECEAPMNIIAQGSGQRILVVDDEELLVSMCTEMLKQLNYTVTGFSSSTKALEVFISDPNRFDLVVTDQRMPDLTGAELTERIHEVRPDIPVILVTGFSEEVSHETAATFGFSDFLPKPYTKRHLSDSIVTILEPNSSS